MDSHKLRDKPSGIHHSKSEKKHFVRMWRKDTYRDQFPRRLSVLPYACLCGSHTFLVVKLCW